MYLFQTLLIAYLASFTLARETLCSNDVDQTDRTDSMGVFDGKVYLVVSGGSRGIGKQIAQTFSKLLNEQSKVLLLARNPETLQKAVDNLPKNVDVSYASVDFGTTSTEQLEGIIKESLKNDKAESFNRAIIVHAAAQVSYDRLIDVTDFSKWHQSFELNMFSPAILNNIFMKIFSEKSTKKYVINLSSYWGLNPDVQLGTFCPARAAKDMYFRVVALENPEVNVLNYLPGFVETDMYYEALEKSQNEVFKAQLKDMIENKKFVTTVQTASCLAEVMKKQNYKSGEYVDYFKSPAECLKA